jgi:hypothetical protein
MRAKIMLALFGVMLTGIGIFLLLRQPRASYRQAMAAPNYDNYGFGRAEEARLIDVGTQPFGTPATYIAECLFHDRILQRQLAAEGWKLREHGFRNGNEMLPYADGRLDVMVLGDIPSLIAMQQQRVGIYALCSQGYNAVIANRWLIPAELKGLSIGYPAGTAAHFALERTLQSANLSIKDITSIPLPPEEMQAALRCQRVQAVAVWEPFITTILEQVPGSAVISSSDTYTYIAIGRDFAKRHPAQLKAVLAAMIRATRWGKLDEENLRTSLQWDRQATLEFTGKSLVAVDANWISRLREDTLDHASYPMLPLDFSNDQGLQHQQFEWLKKTGTLPADAEWQKVCACFNLQLLPEVIGDSQHWKIGSFDYAPAKLYPTGKDGQ